MPENYSSGSSGNLLLSSASLEAALSEAWNEAKRIVEAEKDTPFRAFQKRYKNDPAGFVRDCIKFHISDGPSAYQNLAMEKLIERQRVTIRGPHGLGKTAMAAWVVLWFSLTRDGEDWKIPTTASAWRQLTKYLWPEIKKWARRLKWDIIGRDPFDENCELLNLSLKLSTGEAFALASSDASAIEGAHATHLLYIFDEAKAIPDDIWDGAEGAFASPQTAEAFALAISTPAEPQGRFYHIHARQSGYEDWWAYHVTLEQAIEARRISPEWAEQRRRQWGEDSAVYQNRVLGEFATSGEEGVIPLALVEAANLRWEEWKDAGGNLDDYGELTAIGADIARSGDDKTILAFRYGPIISELRSYNHASTMETTGRIVAGLMLGGIAVVDVIGVGAGVVDRLRELDRPVVSFNAGEATDFRDRSGELQFADTRSAAWWNLREMLELGEILLPPDELLIGDLVAPRWRVISGGRIKVESKLEIKKRIRRSTDSADAVIQAFWTDKRRIFIG